MASVDCSVSTMVCMKQFVVIKDRTTAIRQEGEGEEQTRVEYFEAVRIACLNSILLWSILVMMMSVS